jgi:hypothetical protein
MSIEPITRLQRFLRVLADSSADMPEPLRDLEKCCCYACGHLDTRPELHTTLEKLIASVRDKSIVPPKPNTRLEKYVAAMAGVWDDELPEPITREDKILFEAASGEDVTLSGNPLMLENCIGGKALKALHVYGKSTQDGTPSPDNPVPIVSAGDGGSVTVKVTGRNLIQGINKIIAPSEAIEGGVRIVNDSGGNSRLAFFNADLRKGITYTISFTQKVVQGDGINANIYLPDIGQFVSTRFTPLQDTGKIGIYLNQAQRGTLEITNIQVEIGTASTTYSPYCEQLLTLPTPNGLPGIPVTSGGNYTDPTGQQWVCDEVDLKRGVMVQRVGKAQVNTKNGVVDEEYRLRLLIGEKEASLGDFECIISITPYTSWTSCTMGDFLYLKNVKKPDGSFFTAKELKALALDVDVVYQLATPIETPLTSAELAAYKALTTYAPDTVVQASDGAGLEATYKCNVRKAEKTINDLYAELTAELEA